MNTSLRVIKDNGLHGIIRAEVWDKREYALPVKRETYANTVCLWRVSGRLFLRERPTGENRFWGQIPNLSYYNIHSLLIAKAGHILSETVAPLQNLATYLENGSICDKQLSQQISKHFA